MAGARDLKLRLTVSKSRLAGIEHTHYGGYRGTKDIRVQDPAPEAIARKL